MSEHTKEPWSQDGSHIYAPDGEIICTVNNPGSRVSDYPLVENRRRIVACVNACAGLPTEMLESQGIPSIAAHMRLEKEIEKLRAALLEAADVIDNHEDWERVAEAYRKIARGEK